MAVRFSMARYVAIVDGAPGAYGVVVPDLPGCTSAGPTIDKALRDAVEAVTLWVEDARAGGEKFQSRVRQKSCATIRTLPPSSPRAACSPMSRPCSMRRAR
jgi:predicted RNase H-like HicB family nuclease